MFINSKVCGLVSLTQDYFQVVKRPMDLGTIRDRLEKGEVYKNVKQVLEDVALVWSNCRLYNDDGDPIMELLQCVESSFIKYCQAAGFTFQLTDGAEGWSLHRKERNCLTDLFTVFLLN